MTDCPNGEMRDLLPDLLHGRMAPPQRAAVERHVAACAQCRDELVLLGALRESLHHVPMVDVRRVVGALPAYRASGDGPRGGWRAAAAIAAIVIGGVSFAIAARDVAPERTADVATIPWRDTLLPLLMARSEPPAQVAAQGSAAATRRAVPPAPRELALEHGLGDLTDSELSALLHEIHSLDATPLVDVESIPLVPGSALPPVGGTS